MTRLREEKELKRWSVGIYGEKNITRFFRDIRAFEKAIRADEREKAAKVAEGLSMSYFREAVKVDSTYNRARNEVAAGMGNAIREGK